MLATLVNDRYIMYLLRTDSLTLLCSTGILKPSSSASSLTSINSEYTYHGKKGDLKTNKTNTLRHHKYSMVAWKKNSKKEKRLYCCFQSESQS